MANPRKFSEKIALHNQKQAEETAEFEKIMREVSNATNKSPLSNMEKSDQTSGMEGHRARVRSNVGPMRSRPGEKRIDTSPYSGAYSLQPPDSGWRRTYSDSSLHTNLHDPAIQRRDGHSQLIDGFDTSRILSPDGRPRSSSDVPRVPGINIFPSQEDPGTVQIPIGNNTGSLPDLTSFHFPSPLGTPLDQDDHTSLRSESPGSLSPTNTTNLSQRSTSGFIFGGTPPHEAPGPPQQYANAGITHHQPYHQQHYVYQQPVSPPQQQSPQNVPSHQQPSLSSYRTPVKRPSPQPSPALTVKYPNSSPRSSSPQSPSSPCGLGGFPENSYFISQAQLQHHFEQFSMTDDVCKHIGNQEQPPDQYFSTSPSQQLQYPRGPHPPSTQTPNTPSSIPDITLTDFSSSDELAKDLGVAMAPLDSEFFPTVDCLRDELDPIDFAGLQMLTDPTNLITDQATEDHFRLDRNQ